MQDVNVIAEKPRHLLPPTALVFCGTWLAVQPAHAALLQTCRPSDSPLACKLRSVLTMLDTAAWILGLLLVVAVVAAVVAYRRKPRKLTPEDISADDV